ncbi:MAG: ribonuclease III [Cyanobacteria bacterium P01_H01_bin.130]
MAPSARSPHSTTVPPPPLIYPQRQKQLQQLLDVLGIEGLPNPDWQLLDEALVHCSDSGDRNYERLEFFGDAVLRMAASDYLLTHHRDWSVGDMTAVRNVMVSDRFLSEIAQHYQLDHYLVMGNATTGCTPAQLADSIESLIGAIYTMTRSLRWIHPWLDPFWRDRAPEIYRDPTRQNHKAALQEWTQQHFKALPTYTTTDRHGDVPAPARFEAQAWFQEQHLGTGTGRTRKAAEQAAAKIALTALPLPQALSPPSPSS